MEKARQLKALEVAQSNQPKKRQNPYLEILRDKNTAPCLFFGLLVLVHCSLVITG